MTVCVEFCKINWILWSSLKLWHNRKMLGCICPWKLWLRNGDLTKNLLILDNFGNLFSFTEKWFSPFINTFQILFCQFIKCLWFFFYRCCIFVLLNFFRLFLILILFFVKLYFQFKIFIIFKTIFFSYKVSFRKLYFLKSSL